MSPPPMTDVIVVGAGPTGSATAAFLAREGLKVTVLERAHFPRFAIGESLIPSCLTVLDKLGVALSPETYLRKEGAEFFDEARGLHAIYDFADALPGVPPVAFQVERARFDHQLIEHAVSLGAELREGFAVQTIEPGPDAVQVRNDHETLRARYCVDATGRQRLMATALRSTESFHSFGRAAAFQQFLELSPEAWAELAPTGNLRVLRVEGGWCWVIPIQGRRLSVGVVLREGKLTPDLVDRTVAASEMLTRLTRGTAPPSSTRSSRLASPSAFTTQKLRPRP